MYENYKQSGICVEIMSDSIRTGCIGKLLAGHYLYESLFQVHIYNYKVVF